MISFVTPNFIAKKIKKSHYTPIIDDDFDTKIELIDAMHDNNRQQLFSVLGAFTDVDYSPKVSPIIEDMYYEGIYIGYVSNNTTITDRLIPVAQLQSSAEYRTVFVKFRMFDASLEEQFYYLLYESGLKHPYIDKSVNDAKASAEVVHKHQHKYYFEVIDNQKISHNMRRLYLQTTGDIPHEAGFAFTFVLTSLKNTHNALLVRQLQHIHILGKKVLDNVSSTRPALLLNQKITPMFESLLETVADNSHLQQYKQQTMRQITSVGFNVFRYLPPQQRDSILSSSVGKPMRYYTIRKLIKQPQSQTSRVYVDIFVHENSQGSMWASQLAKGNIIYGTRHFHEKTAHLNSGRCLLICDETSMPTVAWLLEHWDHNISPTVICILNNTADSCYLDEVEYAQGIDNLDITYLVVDPSDNYEYAEQIAQIINEQYVNQDQQILFDNVWGAFEVSQIKKIKKYFRKYNLPSRNVVLRGYWKK